jgi:alkanesulfonate monooxygenase SsuD/methylene tetrahydromethanopterin reductase-like flavin-dependent oxidoreductase (luciferase family)
LDERRRIEHSGLCPQCLDPEGRAGEGPARLGDVPDLEAGVSSVHERSDVARAELHRWFSTVYHNPEGTDTSGIYGTPEQLRARIGELMATGANHLLLNPVCRYAEQLEALAEVVELR